MYPCGEVQCIHGLYISSGIPLIWGVNALHIVMYLYVQVEFWTSQHTHAVQLLNPASKSFDSSYPSVSRLIFTFSQEHPDILLNYNCILCSITDLMIHCRKTMSFTKSVQYYLWTYGTKIKWPTVCMHHGTKQLPEILSINKQTTLWIVKTNKACITNYRGRLYLSLLSNIHT